MTSKQLSQKDLLDKVMVGNFANDTQSSMSLQDGDTLILHPRQVSPYDRNPRRVRNKEYESIKAQLMAQGLQEVMAVTQRPGMPADQFMPARGFNTRLQIILEIFEESSDDRFLQIKCRYVAWESEAKTFTNHMAENEVRGEVTFFDRASSVMTLKTILEEETGNPHGPTELINYLKSQGIKKVNRADIARFKYTSEQLQEALVETLSLGLGPRQIDAISKLHEAADMLWEDAGETDDWDPLFQGILRKLDQRVEKLDDWSYDKLFKEVARELGSNDTQGIERSLASLEFVIETGRLPEKKEYTPFTTTPKDESGTGETTTPKPPSKPRQSTKSSKPKAGSGESTPTIPSVVTPGASDDKQSNGTGNDPSSLLEDAEEDFNDALIDLENDPLLRELAPETDLLEGEDGSLHYQPDHKRYEESPGALEANLEAWRKRQEAEKDKPRKPLSPELQEIFERRQAWEEQLQHDKVAAGRTRATEMRLFRLMQNFKDAELEVLHHHGYASALRVSREFFGAETASHIIRPINLGIGFYVYDWPRNIDFEERPQDAYILLANWYWLVTASGQTKIIRAEQLPQEILDAPFGEIIRDSLNQEGMLNWDQLNLALEKRVQSKPWLLMLQEMMAISSLNLTADQAILTRVVQTVTDRSLDLDEGSIPGAIFRLESRWDRQYSDIQIDRNDHL